LGLAPVKITGVTPSQNNQNRQLAAKNQKTKKKNKI